MASGFYYYKHSLTDVQTNNLATSFNVIGATISNQMNVINRYHNGGGIDPRIVLGVDSLPGFAFEPNGKINHSWATKGVALTWIEPDVVEFALEGVSLDHCKKIVPKMWGSTYNPGYQSYAMVDGHLISATATNAIDAINSYCKDDVSVGIVVAVGQDIAANAIGSSDDIVLASADTGSSTGSSNSAASSGSSSNPDTSTSSSSEPSVTNPSDTATSTSSDTTTSKPDTTTTPSDTTILGSEVTTKPVRDPENTVADNSDSNSSPVSGDATSTTDTSTTDTSPADIVVGSSQTTEGSSSQGAQSTTPADTSSQGSSGSPDDSTSAPSAETPTGSGVTSNTSSSASNIGGNASASDGASASADLPENPVSSGVLGLKFPKGKGTAGDAVMSNALKNLPNGSSVSNQELTVWGAGSPTLRLADGSRGSEGVVGNTTNVQVTRPSCGITGNFYLRDETGTIYNYEIASVGCK